MSTALRSVARVIRSQRMTEGAGFVVRRPFPLPGLEQLDPFLLLDEMGPVTYGPGQAVGAPDHPHRGFETVTYLLEGAVEHRDSTGASGVITPGAVQWMTAGSGIVHSEMPIASIRQLGGRVHGFQLWVNLRAAQKMIAPRYQGFDARELPTVGLPAGGRLVVIAGTVAGVTGPVETTSPVTYAHATLPAESSLVWSLADGHTALVYVVAGSVGVNGRLAGSGDLVALEHTGGDAEIVAGAGSAPMGEGAEVLLLGGEPLREPIARTGPFVMNNRAELAQAFEDYQAGRLGSIPASGSGVTRS